jgi:hypothetical protein
MRVLTAIGILILVGAGGCQPQVSMQTWQGNVDHYVWDQGNGDASVLRDVPTSGQWKGFAIITENDPASSMDVNGVLLAHRQIGSRTYFIYLVGLTRQQQVQDIRVALLWATPEGLQWRWGGGNNDALKAYSDFKSAQWKKLFPGRTDGPWSYTGFPGEGDMFKLSVTANRVTATHDASGAQWTLDIPGPGPTSNPTVSTSN